MDIYPVFEINSIIQRFNVDLLQFYMNYYNTDKQVKDDIIKTDNYKNYIQKYIIINNLESYDGFKNIINEIISKITTLRKINNTNF
jgi:hypothetical protein